MTPQTYELAAPSHDPTEVLIEEVRQRSRRRRRRNLALAVLVLVASSGIYLAASGGNGSPRSRASATPTSALPPAVTSAINKTVAVQSVEVLTSYLPGPGIYQAPDLYAEPLSEGSARTITAQFISGDSEYFANAVGITRLVHLSKVETSPPLRKQKGLSVAQQSAFGLLVDFVRSGSDFVRTAVGTYTFHLALAAGPRGDLRYTGGEIELAQGYVTKVSVYTILTSRSKGADPAITRGATTSVQYKRINHNPRLVAPRLNTPMCLPAGSLILENC